MLKGPESKEYDLAYSVYAFYYANNPSNVHNKMYQRLTPAGRLCSNGPDGPHGLMEIVQKFHPIPTQVEST